MSTFLAFFFVFGAGLYFGQAVLKFTGHPISYSVLECVLLMLFYLVLAAVNWYAARHAR